MSEDRSADRAALRTAERVEEVASQATHRTLRGAVHAYARDPSERNAVMVEATVEALRWQRTGSRS